MGDVLSTVMNSFSAMTFILLFFGVIVGLIFGSIPGLTATMGVALFIPVTFSLDPASGLFLLLGVYVGGISGGLVAATLLGIPGTPSSIATTFDAFPMSKNGEPARALGIGIIASLIGGVLSFVVLVTIAPVISKMAVKMGPAEYFSLTFFALMLISILSKGNMIKGISAGVIGIALSLIGFAPIDGTARFTFGNINLKSGIDLLPLIMGLFAISQILIEVQSETKKESILFKVRGLGVSIKEIIANGWNIIRSSLIGIGFGILPGMGSGASNIVAYAQAKQASKTPEKFGKGTPEGIWAAETANNASVGGALIPLITLGIPGDTVTAILLGGFMIHGIQPGPLLFKTNPDIIYIVYIGFALAMLITFFVMMFGMKLFPHILRIPPKFLYSFLLVMTVVGAYSTNYSIFDIWVMLLFGVIGYIMMKNDYPIAPLILGFVLGPLCEQYLRRALMSSGSVMEFFTRPVSAIFLLIALVLFIYTLYKEISGAKKQPAV
ncbi:tripartite tricarboxylate transporter permease [Sporosarcina luteola]|uniref:tripartite tricarboxylate transporter permease n=1 Tax=Sporosarcina luteola TaxID=582850 RepID=UPI00203D9008|nr:tripartite tricarboxylate transporter permease [Sporosarcina luteola]MCM3709139.1 tripartite tricarboxylate transporter permease [Sporosarcina luteola]